MPSTTVPTLDQLTPEQYNALLQGPAAVPPPGVLPNFVDPPNLRLTSQAVIITCFVIATLSILMRFYTKTFIMWEWKHSDYALLVGWAFYVGAFVPYWGCSVSSGGVDQWNIKLEDFFTFLYDVRLASILYFLSVFFVKVSILLQYLEIFVPAAMGRNAMFWTCHSLIWLNFCYYAPSLFIEIFFCNPIARSWNPLIPGKCVNASVLNVASSVVNAASDLAILVLPQLVIWRLQMPVRNKLVAGFVFSIGIFATASSLARIPFAVFYFLAPKNTSYTIYRTGLFSWVEIGSGILLACIPSISRFIQEQNRLKRAQKVFKRIVGEADTSRTDSSATSKSHKSNVIKSEVTVTVTESAAKGAHSDYA